MDLTTEHIGELLDVSPYALVIVDGQGTIAFVNAPTQALFGYPREELIGRPIEMLIPVRFHVGYPKYFRSFIGESEVRSMSAEFDLYAQRRDGSEVPIEISSSLLTTKQGLLISSAIRDVTDRKQDREQLIAARTEAERANRAKDSFLAAMSRHFQQPLQTLTLLNNVLEKTASNPMAQNAIGVQRTTLASVSALLKSVLDISKLESGAIRPAIADCSLQEIFQRLKTTFDAQTQAKGLSLLIDDVERIIRTDKALFEQVMQHLVANAIRYTQNGVVQLRSVHDAELVRVEVLDTGVGIAANQRDAIFDEFYQLNSDSSDKLEGLGLGLAIVRRTTQLLGHSIEVNSEVGFGSCFSVTVPCGSDVAITLPPKPVPLPRIGDNKAMILIIDDDKHVATSTKMLLKLEGYRVHTASSMEDAMALKEDAEAWPDAIISDYHLANGSSGIEVIGNLRKMAHRSIPAVLVTGDTSSNVSKALEHLGDCTLLSKPFLPNEFLEVLNQLLSARSPV